MKFSVWKVRELNSLIDDIQRHCWFSERTAPLYRELREEMEALVKRVASQLDDRTRLQFYNARRCWAVRNDYAPLPLGGKDGDQRETWAQWFERIWGEPLEVYAARAVKEGIRQKVLEWELATYGSSPLENEKVKAA